MSAPCDFCRRRRAATPAGLCPVCQAQPGIRRLYRRRYPAAWLAHLAQLAERARFELPLFDGTPLPDRPPPRCGPGA